MTKRMLHRRGLLKGAGLGVAAQLLPELRNPAYAAAEVPKNLVLFFTHHGTMPDLWKPTGPGGQGQPTETAFDLPELLAPLKEWKQDLLLLSGFDMKSDRLNPPGDNKSGHPQGQSHALTSIGTSKPLTEGAVALPKGPSIDQVILNALQTKNGGKAITEIPSLQLGMRDAGLSPAFQMLGRVCYDLRGAPLSPKIDPDNVWKLLFGAAAPPTAGGDAATKRRKRALAFALGELNALAGKVEDVYGVETRRKLEAHAEHLSALDGTMGLGVGHPGACAVPAATEFPGRPSTPSGWWGTLSAAMPRLGTLALGCGKTRILTYQVEDSFAPGIHSVVHELWSNPSYAVPNAKAYYVDLAKEFAKLLRLMKDTPTADGRDLLYHSAVLWCGELAEPGHSTNNLKWILAGQAGGAFKTGRWVGFGDYARGPGNWDDHVPSHADLFLAIADALGASLATFGDPRAVTGPMPKLKG